MNEVIAVRVEGAPEGLPMRAALVRMEGPEEPWNIFIEAAETDHWLSIGECKDFRDVVTFPNDHTARVTAKLAILLGWDWGDVWDKTEEVLAWSQQALDSMGPAIRWRVQQTSVEDMISYRKRMENMTFEAGEIIWQDLTGVQPDVSRN